MMLRCISVMLRCISTVMLRCISTVMLRCIYCDVKVYLCDVKVYLCDVQVYLYCDVQVYLCDVQVYLCDVNDSSLTPRGSPPWRRFPSVRQWPASSSQSEIITTVN